MRRMDRVDGTGLTPGRGALAACGDDEPAQAGGGSPSPAAETGFAGGTGTTGDISTAEADGVGEVLVDAEGFTLTTSCRTSRARWTCTEDCAANWPPAIVDAVPDAGDLPKELGTVENPESGGCRSRAGRCTGTSATPRRGRPPARAAIWSDVARRREERERRRRVTQVLILPTGGSAYVRPCRLRADVRRLHRREELDRVAALLAGPLARALRATERHVEVDAGGVGRPP